MERSLVEQRAYRKLLAEARVDHVDLVGVRAWVGSGVRVRVVRVAVADAVTVTVRDRVRLRLRLRVRVTDRVRVRLRGRVRVSGCQGVRGSRASSRSQGRYRGDTGEIQWRYRGDAGEIQGDRLVEVPRPVARGEGEHRSGAAGRHDAVHLG